MTQLYNKILRRLSISAKFGDFNWSIDEHDGEILFLAHTSEGVLQLYLEKSEIGTSMVLDSEFENVTRFTVDNSNVLRCLRTCEQIIKMSWDAN